MKVEIRDISETEAHLEIAEVHPYFVNALRRTLLTEVPKLAIDQVTFYDNTSALFDEIVAHRIGLVPIKTDPSTLNLVDHVDDEGEPTYKVRYTLTKEGPCTVMSGDLEPEDPAFAPADSDIPIVELLEGQRLILECAAILGVGTTHAKWQTCQAVGYKYYPTAELDAKKISADDAAKIIERTPVGILTLEGDKIAIQKPEDVNRADYAAEVAPDAFKVTYNDRRFLFRFETDGALKAEDALMKAVEILKERFEAFGAAAKDL